ncbi:NAD(P)-dependent oxidoreductase [Spiractinospora alimapuensis]|uniref:NAD-dependent epimerase/dehydratase family protein n=1 Tax=Spiractinospora alimapuensis TaxID=2820884 RepID=UPI001F3E6F2E|nr:NAD(P)-dependent oxidoreductase [Spiractinospora alimapuensis]QVQ53510.1 NAD(P)-dependent oxidoreductase [Spiractinospora alimapuensis]
MTRVVAVTGATGFLGAAVRTALRGAGIDVLATDLHAAPDVTAVDVGDSEGMDAAFAAAGPLDAVVHLAAAGSGDRGLVAGADLDPAAAVRTNVEGFVRVVEAAARNGARRVVWSSSTTVYGTADQYPAVVDESAALRPTMTYGATKAACEFLGPLLAARLGVDVVALRLPMVYGPGRWYGGSQEPLVRLRRALRAGDPAEVTVWEGDADWIHVRDAAEAVVALLRAETVAAAYHVVGHRGSLADIADALLAAAGRPDGVRVAFTPDGAPDLPATDDARIRDDTGWAPQLSDITLSAADYLHGVDATNRRNSQ